MKQKLLQRRYMDIEFAKSSVCADSEEFRETLRVRTYEAMLLAWNVRAEVMSWKRVCVLAHPW